MLKKVFILSMSAILPLAFGGTKKKDCEVISAKELRRIPIQEEQRQKRASRRAAKASTDWYKEYQRGELEKGREEIPAVLACLKRRLIAAAKEKKTSIEFGRQYSKDEGSYNDTWRLPRTKDYFTGMPGHNESWTYTKSWNPDKLEKISEKRYPLLYAVLEYCQKAGLEVEFVEEAHSTYPIDFDRSYDGPRSSDTPVFAGSEHFLQISW